MNLKKDLLFFKKQFVDSDTSFEADSIRYLEQTLRSSDNMAGVCGKLALSNFSCGTNKWNNWLFHLSTIFIVGYQYYEYHFNQIIGKRKKNILNSLPLIFFYIEAEAAYDSVSCLPGAFSLLRSDDITTIEAHQATEEEKNALKEIEQERSILMTQSTFGNLSPFSFFYNKYRKTLPLILSDFFSRPTVGNHFIFFRIRFIFFIIKIGIIDRNLYELGEDRTLTIRFLEKGKITTYDPRAVAYTNCPDTIRLLMLQRRRWNNSTFVNLIMMILRPKLWLQLKTIPIMIFTFYDLIGSYLIPTNALLILSLIWDPLFVEINQVLGTRLTGPNFVIYWFLINVVVIATTKMDSSDMFYVFNTFLTGLLMVASLYFFLVETLLPPIQNFALDPGNPVNIPLFVIILIFPIIHLAVSIFRPYTFILSAFYYVMLPTNALVIPMYAFFHLDDFSWGNR